MYHVGKVRALRIPYKTTVSNEAGNPVYWTAILQEGDAAPEAAPIEELNFSAMSMGQKQDYIRDRLYKWYRENYGDGEYGMMMYCQEVYLDHPTLGNSVIVQAKGATYAIPYQVSVNGEIAFGDKPQWQQVVMTYVPVNQPDEPTPMAASEATEAEPVAEALAESMDGTILEVSEASPSKASDDEPLKMKIKLIEPGWGNKRDNHYYSREMLANAAPKFVGAKMYVTDHKPDEKNVMTEVGSILKHDGFTESGAPVMEVGIHDPYFARSVRNRQKLGTLHQLENSILATGSVKLGEVGGKPGKIVESIDDVKSVDFVTRAGAGGHALALAESEEGSMPQETVKETTEGGANTSATGTITTTTNAQNITVTLTETALLSEADVLTLLKEDAGLPEASKERLSKGKYADKEALQEAVVAEKDYIKKLTRSGKPAGLGESAAAPAMQGVTLAERREALDAIKYGRGGNR